ncbi:MAG: glycosyltransferase family 1 protein [bacterium]|nr:glycosyltransferase family 1 protein [bacterium]
MLIGIDASRALRPIKTGTEWYSIEIIRHLVKLDQKNNYILYSNKPPEAPLLDLPNNVSWRVMPFTKGWTLVRLSWEMLTKSPDILFIPAHTLPLFTPKKSVVMVHDLGFIHNPKLYPARQKIYHKFVINYVKNHATHIITPTKFTKQDLIQTFNIPSTKITPIWHGYDKNLYRPRPNTGHASAQYSPYIFYIGRLETKKNIVNLIKAFILFRAQNPTQTTKLVLAGKPSHGYDKIKEEIKTAGSLQQDIIELGYLSEDQVPIYMSNAELFAFPTSFEGFGMPIIQAMACGCPVLASNNTCIPEITGNAAILINPDNPQGIADGMTEILTEKKTQNDLIEKGLKQAEKFSWENSAQKTLEVIEKTI